MKVVLIDPSLFTLPYDRALAAALVDRGHRVTTVGRPLGDGESWPEAAGDYRALFYRGRACTAGRGARRSLAKGLDHLATLARLPGHLAGLAPDVVHFQWAPLPAADALAIPRLARIAPVVLTMHDTVPFNGDPTARLQGLGALAVCRRADRVIVHTEEGRARLADAGVDPAKLARIGHGPLGGGTPAPGAVPPDPDGPVTIRLLGKLKPYKGADVLVEAIARLPDALKARVRVEIAGEAHMDPAPLERRIAELGLGERIRVEPGFLAEADFDRRLAGADILAFPYRRIDASGVMAACMAHGRPVVASDLGSFADLLEPVRDCALVPPGDPDALAAALAPLIADADRRAALGAEVAALARRMGGWDDAARATEACYAALTGAPANAGAAPARLATEARP
ncbi:MAG: glycosyltransferase [Azospirillaceae bacterium]